MSTSEFLSRTAFDDIIASLETLLSQVQTARNELDGVVDNLSDLLALEANLTELIAVFNALAEINAVAGNESNINAVAGNETNINALANIESSITALANAISELLNLESNLGTINSVNDNESNINAVAAINSEINTLAASIAELLNLEGNLGAVTAVDANETNINTVADNIGAIQDAASALFNFASAQTAMPIGSGDTDTWDMGDSYSGIVLFRNGSFVRPADYVLDGDEIQLDYEVGDDEQLVFLPVEAGLPADADEYDTVTDLSTVFIIAIDKSTGELKKIDGSNL